MRKKAFWIVMLCVVCVLGAYSQNINVNSMNGFGNYTMNNWSTVVNNEAVIKMTWEFNGYKFKSFSVVPANHGIAELNNIVSWLLNNQLPPQNTLDPGDSFYVDVGVQNKQGNYNNGYIIYFYFRGGTNWTYVAYKYSK